MSEIVKLRTLAEIEDEAATWVWRMDSDTVANADRVAFEAWLKRDPRHRRAFEELGGIWRHLDALAEAKRDEKIATFAEVREKSHAPPSRWRHWVAAAAVSAAIGLGVLFSYQRGHEAQAVATSVGQQRSLTLADGSVIDLNTNSELETQFVTDRREVYLGKGEAHFSVAHDPGRPFRVHAAGAIVQAIGTQFDVRVRDGRSLEVIVTEGRVEVLSPATSGGDTAAAGSATTRRQSDRHALAAGQRFQSVDGAGAVASIDTDDISRVLAWRKGALVFDGESLARAVVELNRYTETRFVITDPAVGELRVGGHFKINDVEGVVRALESALPITIRRTDDGLIFIEPRH